MSQRSFEAACSGWRETRNRGSTGSVFSSPGGNAVLSRNSLLMSNSQSLHASTMSFRRPAAAPPVWPAILASFLHNISMGAAMLLWVDVCKEVIAKTSPEHAGSSAIQQFNGRLLATNAFCELLSSQFVGVASDKYGRRVVQCSAQLGQVIDYTAAAFIMPSLIGQVGTIPAGTASVLLFITRGTAGVLGNNRVSLQCYTTDISSVEECPTRLSYLGAALVLGMCMGSVVVATVDQLRADSYRACFLFSACLNVCVMLIVKFLWRDIALKKDFECKDASPVAGLQVLGLNSAMLIYAALISSSSFSLNMFTSTLAYYGEHVLGMDKSLVIALGGVWALESAFCLAVVQPWLVRRGGEILTLKIAFASSCMFYLLFSNLTESSSWVAFPIMIFFSFGSVAYPLAVALATREVPPEAQGSLQGAVSILETVGKIMAPLLASDVLIPKYEGEGEFHGMVYFVAGGILLPGILLAHQLYSATSRIEVPPPLVTVEMQ